jgi:hypothetical protein
MNHEQIRSAVEKSAQLFYNRHGGSLPDLIQDAWVLFLKCAQNHNPARSSLGARAQFCVYKGLLSQRRNELGRYRRKPETCELPPDISCRAAPPDIRSLLADLSGDAATVARLILDCGPRAQRPAVRRLAKRRGVALQQIDAGFRELEAAFS